VSSSPAVSIGPFVVGEKPAPLQYQFLDSSGVPINLGAYTAKFSCVERGAPTITAACVNATVTDAAAGKVTYVWNGTEWPTAGRYEAELWVGNTTQRFASVLITFTVRTAVACVPVI
jgi:hypothetical protein